MRYPKEAMSRDFARQALEAAYVDADVAQKGLKSAIVDARQAGLSWEEIGAAVEMSAYDARKRWVRTVEREVTK